MPRVEIEVQVENDGSHFSQEDYWILTLNMIMMGTFFFFLGFSAFKYI
jgi:hypothetical protein